MIVRPVGFFSALLLASFAYGCDQDEAGSKAADHAAPAIPGASEASGQAAPPDQKVSGEHAVTCGCTLEAVGHCGEYAEVDGQFVELQLPASSELGKMPFCGKEGLRAKIEGEVKAGRLVASSFELNEATP